MTDINLGKQHDDSTLKLHVEAADGSNTKIDVADQYDRSKREVVVNDSTDEGARHRPNSGSAARGKQDNIQRLNSVLAFVFGVIFIAVILTLVIFIPNPTPAQARVFSVVLALAAGGFASFLSGMLNVRLSLKSKVVIGATGALAVFVIVYFFVPAMAR
jgi:VIT1/CCC1 family predicted Fe2+/Mn2+ transporter